MLYIELSGRWTLIALLISQSSFALETQRAIQNELSKNDCDFSEASNYPDPETLLRQFLEKDALGHFMIEDPWLESAVLCPSSDGDSESTNIISKYEYSLKNQNDFSKDYEVTYWIEGALELASTKKAGIETSHYTLTTQTKRVTELITLLRTKKGWRLKQTPRINGSYIYARSALRNQLLGLNDKQRLELEKIAKKTEARAK